MDPSVRAGRVYFDPSVRAGRAFMDASVRAGRAHMAQQGGALSVPLLLAGVLHAQTQLAGSGRPQSVGCFCGCSNAVVLQDVLWR